MSMENASILRETAYRNILEKNLNYEIVNFSSCEQNFQLQ